MFRSSWRNRLATCLLAVILASAVPAAAPLHAAEPLAPDAPLDTPATLVSDADGFALRSPVLYWITLPSCGQPPGGADPAAAPESPAVGPDFADAAGDPVTISRTRTTGSDVRVIFSRNDPRPAGQCNPYKFVSNLVADDTYLYWFDDVGLQRLPINANPGEPPTLLAAVSSSQRLVQMVDGGDVLWGRAGGFIAGYRKADGHRYLITFVSPAAKDVQYDGEYFYFLTGSGLLRRVDVSKRDENSFTLATLATGASAFIAPGARRVCGEIQFGEIPIPVCRTARPVFYGSGNIVRWLDTTDDKTGVLYTAPTVRGANPGLQFAGFNSFTADGTRFFALAQYIPPCPGGSCFPVYTDYLVRTPYTLDYRDGFTGAAAAELWLRNGAPNPLVESGLTTDKTFLFWRVLGAVYRLPNDAAALPKVNLRATGLEISQGIQNSNNTVRLIQGRDTTVRLFVQSDGADVPDVTARLTVWIDGKALGLSPARRITVRRTPDRWDLNQSFLFYIPGDWLVDANTISVAAQLNPYGFPLEPTLADNSRSVGPLTLSPSPRLHLIFAEMSYAIGNTTYTSGGTGKNVHWIMSAYPLGWVLRNGELESALDYQVWDIFDSGLGARVNRQFPACEAYVTRDAKGNITKDEREFCASDYVNSLLARERTRRGGAADTFIYGQIPDTGTAGQFPRGQAGSSKVSSGPDSTPWYGFYAGHEVGHTVGLGHPATGNTQCGLDGSDPTPSHLNAHVGANDDTINGLYASYGTAVLIRGSQWTDFMAYCRNATYPNQWISDQNYERIYNNLTAAGVAAAPDAAPGAALAGDWLSAYGSIAPAGDRASLALVERSGSVASRPAAVAGGYALALVDGQGGVLAQQAFTPEAAHDGWSSFAVVMPFAGGAAQVQVRRLSDGGVLASRAISANPPTVANLRLETAPTADNPLAVLAWDAGDADGDRLTFDLYYSRDGGATQQPVRLGATERRATINTASLGGGSGQFLVVASDGAQAAEAGSPVYTLPARPPVIRSVAPDNGTRVNWGQDLVVEADVLDPQDGRLGGAALQWTVDGQPAGQGAQLALSKLKVGARTLELTARNSAGQTATAARTFEVVDDLSVPGPELSVTPSQVDWSISGPDRPGQAAVLQLVNAGGGFLSWRAESDAPWLSISQAEGGVPLAVTLTGDPAGLARGLHTAAVTFTALSGAQQVVVPVALWIEPAGYTAPADPPPPLDHHVRLPVILR